VRVSSYTGAGLASRRLDPTSSALCFHPLTHTQVLAQLKGCRFATPLASFLSQSFLPSCTFFSGAKPLGSRQAVKLCTAFAFQKLTYLASIF
jgi:hypothetical protein